MALKTIEQLLKPIIQQTIQTLLTGYSENTGSSLYTLKMANNLRFFDKNDTAKVIPAIIQGGTQKRSTTRDLLEWQKTFAINFRVEVNYLQEVMAILETYMMATNRYVSEVTDTRDHEPIESDVVYKYYFVWDFANKSGDPVFDEVKADSNNEGIERETRQFQYVYLSGSVYYSVGAPIDDHRFGIYLLSGTAPGPNKWSGVSESDYNAATTKLDFGIAIDELTVELPDATEYVTYSVGRVYLTTEEEYRYFKAVPDGVVDVYEYVPLLGKVQNQTQLQPSFNVTPLVNQGFPEYGLIASSFTKTYTVGRILGNVLHDFLMRKYFEGDTETKYDCQVEIKIISLNITKRHNAKLTNIVHIENEQGESIAFSVILLDEIVEV